MSKLTNDSELCAALHGPVADNNQHGQGNPGESMDVVLLSRCSLH